MTVPDINKIASAVAVELTKSFGSAIIREVPKQIKRQMSYIFPQFKSYLEETYDKCANVKTIINKDRSFGIEEIYVPGTFKFDEEIISDQDVMQMIRDMHPTVVVGFGGIGKTVFTKQLWCSIFAEPGGKIPVFLELRRLNRITDIDLTTYIRISMTNGDEIFDERMFQSFLASGSFVFIFDGFDELLDSKKEKIAQEILDMAGKYRENGIVVSSRYLDTFNSWQRFRIVRAQHFSRKQTEMLLEKVPYDRRTKKVFKKEIIDSKYQQYQEFLSTPLLTLMMLMTFSQFAEVPDKKSIFYRYAFLTLYSWHDSSKEVFNREKQSGLTIDEFEKFFAIFCFLSYINRQLDFSTISFKNYISRSKSYISSDFESEKIITEVCEAVNLMYRDGDIFIFTHRSFQEYFTAFAIVTYFQSKIVELIDHVRSYGDSVLGLMGEINQDVVDEYYIDAVADRFQSEIKSITREKDQRENAKTLRIHIVIGFGSGSSGHFLKAYAVRQEAESWNFVRNITEIFYGEFEKEGIVQMDMIFNISSPEVLSLAGRIQNFLNLPNNKDFVVVYDVAADEFAATSCDDLVEEFSKSFISLKESNAWFPMPDHGWNGMANEVMVKIKSNYVFASKKVASSRKRVLDKSKGIDDVLSEFRLS